MKALKTITTVSFLFTIMLFAAPTMFSQEVIAGHGIDQISELDVEDENSLHLNITKKVKKTSLKKKRKVVREKVDVEQIKKMLDRGNNLRFRKKRDNNKCFVDRDTDCNKTKNKNAL
ncbi:hypothetical protein [Tenacibaculum sp. 190524A02b]|uniref:Secreted protein n=1 Tax=Tenacibaculum vairaonense TaxID=3137860 RepID=A0ABM9PKP0_9FLAO